MSLDVVVVVRCADRVRDLYSTIESALRSALRPAEIVVVTDPATPGRALPWIRSLVQMPRLNVVHSDSRNPGACRNAAIRTSSAPAVVCLDAGSRLDARYIDLASQALERERVDCMTSASLVVGHEVQWVAGQRFRGPSTLAGDPVEVHPSSMFRRQLWESLGGFDETLPVLDDYDFWIRASVRGGTWSSLPHVLVTQLDRDDSLYHSALVHPARVETLRTLVNRHRPFFEAHAAEALYGFERQALRLSQRYRERLARRDALAAELTTLRAEREHLNARASEESRPLDLGDFGRTAPISTNWGVERGTPVDRHYIEQFLATSAGAIQGVVLEVQESDYARRFGGTRVLSTDVLDVDPANERATVIADLRSAFNLPSGHYDCVILTQTLHVIPDPSAVIGEVARILKPGGTLLATFPCASRVCLEYGAAGDFWRFTEAGVRELLLGSFPIDAIETRSYGNVLVTTAFQYGLAAHEIAPEQFNAHDPFNPTIVAARARKPVLAVAGGEPGNASGFRLKTEATKAARTKRAANGTGAVLAYHRLAAPRSDVHGLAVSPSVFRSQLEILRRSFTVLPLGAFVEAHAASALPERAVAITFDDGYRDSLTDAAPMLAEYGLPATFFVTTAGLPESVEYWWDTLERLLLTTSEVPPELRLAINQVLSVLDTSTPEARARAHADLYGRLKSGDLDQRHACIAALLAWAGAAAPAPDAVRMTAGELRQLAAFPGCRIGAHTVNHLALSAQPPSVIRSELAECRNTLESLLGIPVETVAYPYGDHDAEVTLVAAEAGFIAGLTCDARAVGPQDARLALPRLTIGAEPLATFEQRLFAVLACGSAQQPSARPTSAAIRSSS